MGEAGAAECRPWKCHRSVAELVRGIRSGTTPVASIHAFFDRGAVAPVAAAARREVHCAGSIPRGSKGMEKSTIVTELRPDSGGYRRAAEYSRGDEARAEEESARGIFERRGSGATGHRGKSRQYPAPSSAFGTEDFCRTFTTGRRRCAFGRAL